VQELYVRDESLAERGLRPQDLVMDVKMVNGAQVAQILEGAAKVLPF
jgi:sulfur relay (sulfurtransferase) DsrF/TusC family protein